MQAVMAEVLACSCNQRTETIPVTYLANCQECAVSLRTSLDPTHPHSTYWPFINTSSGNYSPLKVTC